MGAPLDLVDPRLHCSSTNTPFCYPRVIYTVLVSLSEEKVLLAFTYLMTDQLCSESVPWLIGTSIVFLSFLFANAAYTLFQHPNINYFHSSYAYVSWIYFVLFYTHILLSICTHCLTLLFSFPFANFP